MINARVHEIINQSIKELAQTQVSVSYHDGQVNCRIIENRNTGKKYFIQGQLARCIKTGRFVSFKSIFC